MVFIDKYLYGAFIIITSLHIASRMFQASIRRQDRPNNQMKCYWAEDAGIAEDKAERWIDKREAIK